MKKLLSIFVIFSFISSTSIMATSCTLKGIDKFSIFVETNSFSTEVRLTAEVDIFRDDLYKNLTLTNSDETILNAKISYNTNDINNSVIEMNTKLPGKTTLKLSAENSYNTEVEVTVVPITIELTPDTVELEVDSIARVSKSETINQNFGELTFQSSNKLVATAELEEEYIVITWIAVGTANITVSSPWIYDALISVKVA